MLRGIDPEDSWIIAKYYENIIAVDKNSVIRTSDTLSQSAMRIVLKMLILL